MVKYTMLSEKDTNTLGRLLSRDENALREFYTEHKKSLLHYLLKTLERQDAEEVLQDAFIDFIESLRNFNSQSSLKTYLYSIAKHKTLDRIRKKKAKKILFSYLPEHIVETLGVVFLTDTIDKELLIKKIEHVFEKLPNDYVLVLRLKYTEGYKVSAIAKKVKLSFKATESLIFRARMAFIKTYTCYDGQDLFKPQ